MPPYDWAAVALVSWMPLLFMIGRVSGRALFGLTFLHGLVLNLTTQWWIAPALVRTVHAPSWAAVGTVFLLAVLQGVRTPAVLLLVHWARGRGCPLCLSFPVGMALAEAAYPLLFPWTMALQVHAAPVWLQAAAFGGPSAITLWLAAVNALFAEALVRFSAGRSPWRPLAGVVTILGSASLFGHWAIGRQSVRERSARAAQVVVGHIVSPPDGSERDPVPALRQATIAAERSTPGVTLAVWPEVAVRHPVAVDDVPGLARDFLLRDRALGNRGPILNVPLLVGTPLRDGVSLNNSAILVRSPGALLGRYDKKVLMPLGEASLGVPGLASLESFIPAVVAYSRGADTDTVMVDGHALATSICYEDILTESFRRTVLDTRAELLVNLTSDAWFRESSAADLHFGLAKLRSVEHRKYLVRATRDGVSAVVDSTGRVRERLQGGSTTTRIATIRWLPGHTLYAEYGHAWLPLMALGGLLASASWRSLTFTRAVRQSSDSESEKRGRNSVADV